MPGSVRNHSFPRRLGPLLYPQTITSNNSRLGSPGRTRPRPRPRCDTTRGRVGNTHTPPETSLNTAAPAEQRALRVPAGKVTPGRPGEAGGSRACAPGPGAHPRAAALPSGVGGGARAGRG